MGLQESRGERRMMDSGDQFGVGAVFQEYGEHLASLTVYLETEALATKEQVSELIGLNSTTTVRLDIEEYLMGLCHLSNELSRLTVNCVTSEDYSRPERIATFLSTLHTGFRQLNLKNDNLRKKFDEVVYDLSIRGLNKPVVKQVEGGDEGAE